MIGIRFYFGFDDDPVDRMRKISEHGFDAIFTSPNKKYEAQNGTLAEQVANAKKYGLKLSSLHSSYDTPKLPLFWKRGIRGWLIERKLAKEIRIAKEFGFTCLVVHLDGVFSNVGKKRLLRLLDIAKECDLPLAIENLDNEELFIQVFKNIEHDYMKFCYDAGHQNCFTPQFDVLNLYGDKLITIHFHDNMGKKDEHTLNLYGKIDWDKIARDLSKFKDVSIDYELTMADKHGLTDEEILDICLKQGKDFEFLLNKYRRERLKNIKIEFK